MSKWVVLVVVMFTLVSGCSEQTNESTQSQSAVAPAIEESVPIAAEVSPATQIDVAEGESLFGTRWLVVEIQGETVVRREGARPAFIQLLKAEGRVHGFSGCNTFNGSFTNTGDQFTFGPMMTTLMACGEDDRIELEYLQALDVAERFVVRDGALLGFQGEDVVVVFEADSDFGVE
jgi:heat shock protein HslJ